MDIFWTFYLNHLSPLWGYFLTSLLEKYTSLFKKFFTKLNFKKENDKNITKVTYWQLGISSQISSFKIINVS